MIYKSWIIHPHPLDAPLFGGKRDGKRGEGRKMAARADHKMWMRTAEAPVFLGAAELSGGYFLNDTGSIPCFLSLFQRFLADTPKADAASVWVPPHALSAFSMSAFS